MLLLGVGKQLDSGITEPITKMAPSRGDVDGLVRWLSPMGLVILYRCWLVDVALPAFRLTEVLPLPLAPGSR